MTDCTPRVIAVIVTYRPSSASLRRLLDILSGQVAGIVIADNGSEGVVDAAMEHFDPSFAVRVDLGSNLGIAAAINRGADVAFERGATHLLLSDQDSAPAANMVAVLLDALNALDSGGIRVATVGPRYVDSGYAAPFLKTVGLRLVPAETAVPNAPVEVDFVITSGSLVSAESWRVIGPMVDDLFIDYVDIEWGLRARARAYLSFGIPGTEMGHSLGDRRMNFLGQLVPIHSPLRHYYQIRNPLWLYRQPWIPLNWKLVDGFRLLLRFAFNSVFVSPRIENIRYMFRGLLDGLAGRLGRFE